MPSLNFLTLPVDIHVLIGEHLQPQDLLPLALTSRTTKVLYNKPLARRVRLDGAAQLLTFVKRCGEGIEPTFCPIGHPLPHSLSSNKQPRSPRSRADAVHELELQEPGTLQGPGCWDLAVMLDQLEGGGGTPGGVLGALIQLCSSLRKLRVLQSSLPFTGALALALTTWTPALSALTFRTKHCDAAALALAVQSLPLLRTLDVSGVKTCGCRGPVGALKAASELGLALAAAPRLRRLVFTASIVAGTGEGIIFHHLAHSQTSIESLEIRRSPVPGKALAKFLASSAAGSLQHLFLGGLKRVKASDLVPAESTMPAFVASGEALDLQLDGRLCSIALFKALGHRIDELRIFEPDFDLLLEALPLLPRLRNLIVCPREGQDASTLAATLEQLGAVCAARVSVGDEEWLAIEEEKAEMKVYQAEAARAAAAADDELDRQFDEGGIPGCYSGGGIDVWRDV